MIDEALRLELATLILMFFEKTKIIVFKLIIV